MPDKTGMMSNNPAFDGLRALAILLVFLFHSRMPGFKGGFIGVDLFFVLSGYLITSLLKEEIARTGSLSLIGFYRNRALRLWPALLLMLGAYLAIAPYLWPELDAPGDALLAGLYLSDYSYAWFERPEIVSHTWSLAVEAQFYLLWPFAVILLARLERRQAIAVLALLYLAATVWHFYWAMAGTSWNELYYRFDMRTSGLILGAFLAFAAFDPGKRAAEILGTVSLLVFVLLAAQPLWRTPSGMMLQPIIDLASAGLVAVLASRQPTFLTAALSMRPAVHLGLISYSLYLWHYPIIRVLRPHDWIIATVVGAVLSLLLAQLSYAYVEAPFRRLRQGWRKRGEPATALQLKSGGAV